MPIGILAQIIKHLSTFVITTAPFSFFYITIIPVLWDASCRITYTTQITEREGSAGLKSIDVKSQKNLQLHLSSSVIDFSVFKLPGNYWCYVHLHPIWKKQPVLRKQADKGWRFHGKENRCPLLTRGGQDRKPLHWTSECSLRKHWWAHKLLGLLQHCQSVT